MWVANSMFLQTKSKLADQLSVMVYLQVARLEVLVCRLAIR